MTGVVSTDYATELRRFGADEASLRLLDVDGPDLLPYASLLSARGDDDDLDALGAVYEWQGAPLIFLASRKLIGDDNGRLQRIRRLLAMRGDAPYVGVIGAGRLDVYQIALDDRRPADARVEVGVSAGQAVATLAHLANARPGAPVNQRQ